MVSNNIINKNILVAVDGSAASQSSAKLAIHLAQLYHDTVNGLYVVDSNFITGAYTENQAELEGFTTGHSRSELFSQLKEQGNLALDQLKDNCFQSGVPVTKELVFGRVSDVIEERGQNAAFLSLGRRGRGHAGNQNYLGHNFRKILHSFKNPIIVGGEDLLLIRRILLTYPDQESLDHAINILPMVVGPLLGDTALRESHKQQPGSVSEQSQPSPQEILSTYEVFQFEGKSVEEIINEATHHDVDFLILVGYHHHATLPWASTVIEQVLQEVNLPAIII